MNFQVFKLDLEKAEEPEIKLPTSVGSSKKQESPIKISTSALLTRPKPLLCGPQQILKNPLEMRSQMIRPEEIRVEGLWISQKFWDLQSW